MKIGVVCYPTYGGSGIVATELGKAFAEKGHEVHFISYRQPVRLDVFSKNIFFHEVDISDYPLFEHSPYELTLTSKLVDVAIHEKLDILHVHYAIPHASAAYTAKKILESKGLKLPFITTLHGTDITLLGKDQSFKPVIEFAINHSDVVTTVSESLKRDTLKYFNVKEDIKVVPNFIDCTSYCNSFDQSHRDYFANNDERILIHVSNFRKVKRVEDVIRIFDIVNKKTTSKLLLVGDGPERANLESLCRELGICDSVKFLGKTKDITTLMSISDVFLLPSENESFGLVALEAMACGVPVVSSNAGGLTEVNEHGKTGYLSDVGDVEGMARFTLDILKDQQTLDLFKKSALLHSEKFSIDKVLPLYEAIYDSLV